MNTRTISRVIRTALLAGPATCGAVYAACGGLVDESGVGWKSDASPQDDSAPVEHSTDDGGVAVDSGCAPEIDIDGACPGPYTTAIVRTCGQGNGDCQVACKPFFKTCSCDYGGPPYSVCMNLEAGLIACSCQGAPGGRWVEGMERRVLREQTAGAFFAWMVWGESTSIHAFEVLARELRAHRAPRRLLVAARRAKREELRHTRMGVRLAKRHGVDADVAVAPKPAPVRTLEAIALENAVEACVTETWSALLARAQAERAADPLVRRIFDRIATEEASHAALAWSIAEWASARLSARANARIGRQARRAIAKLRGDLVDPGPELRLLGIPSREDQVAMLGAIERSLWSSRLP